MLTAKDFRAYFEALHGYRPFGWQQRLVDAVAEAGTWPAAIDAPTGAGKTSVIDVHLFVNALCGPARPPRLLALTVNRRSLVDDHWDHALQLQQKLSAAVGGQGILAEVAEQLSAMSALPEPVQTPFILQRLRGGADIDSAWRSDPLACRVLCATPDMWGSRVLFRGYGTSKGARPVDAGLLAYDAVVVMDEAHLNRQLALTARQVARWEPEGHGGPRPLQVVLTTATLDTGEADPTVGVLERDLESDGVLARRMKSAKRLSVRRSSNADKARAKTIVDACLDLDENAEPGTIACVCDTVKVALLVCDMLRKRLGQRRVSVRSLVGRMRPHDVTKLRRDHPGLFSLEGDPQVRFLVATQTVEVGVDMDLAAMVTEIAPGAALAQRFGRVNRVGKRQDAEIVVVVPEKPGDLGPYAQEDIEAAAAWLDQLSEHAGDVSPWALRNQTIPGESPRRLLWQSLELGDVEHLANTSDVLLGSSPDYPGADDLALWLNDQLDGESEAFVAVRRLPEHEDLAAELLSLVPPQADELFRVGLGRAREIVSTLEAQHQRVIVYDTAEGQVSGRRSAQPGDVLVVGEDACVFNAQTADADGSVAQDVLAACDTEVAVATTGGMPQREVGKGLGSDPVAAVLKQGADMGQDGRFTIAERRELAGLARRAGLGNRLPALLEHQPARDVDVAVRWDELTEQGFLVASRRHSSWSVDTQVWSQTDRVSLIQHQQDVADRARLLAEGVGLPADMVESIARAGALHDEGKRDSRFQVMLGSGDEVLAKSGTRSRVERRRRVAESGLPVGWRHEQLSAVAAWISLPVAERDLVTRLVGTSHGHGRGIFNAASADLLQGAEPDDMVAGAHELYDAGLWDALVERTNLQYGHWRMAYCEALLRAADTSISAEGK